MAYQPATPPVLRFTLRLLDSASLCELARVCTRDLVDLFGVHAARVADADATWSAYGQADAGPGLVTLSFRLSAADETPVRLEVVVDRGPDLSIVRHQLLDLVAVVRRAWRDRLALANERQRAREDMLTGLDNRRAILEYLRGAFDEANESGRPLTVMLVDLDHFKAVNDTLGHPAGDDVLQLAAKCFRDHLRPSDRVCRWGGDEFLIAIAGLPAGRAVAVAERLRHAFSQTPRARGTTMTIGVADTTCIAGKGANVEDLIELADGSLYEAKRAGRNRIAQARHLSAAG